MTFTKYLSIEKKKIINPRFESAGQTLVIILNQHRKFSKMLYMRLVIITKLIRYFKSADQNLVSFIFDTY